MSKKPTLDEMADRIDELTGALQRERADAENLRRRHEQQYAQLKKLVKAQTIRELLPVIDNCERLLHHTPSVSKVEPWKQGVGQIGKQLNKTLDDMGVKRIKAVGEVFNPALHEAVGVEEPNGEPKQGADTVVVVCEELQPGYIVDGEVIRHAMVKVRLENA